MTDNSFRSYRARRTTGDVLNVGAQRVTFLFADEHNALSVRQPRRAVAILLYPKTFERLCFTSTDRQQNNLGRIQQNRNHRLAVRRSSMTMSIAETYRRRAIRLAQIHGIVCSAALTGLIENE